MKFCEVIFYLGSANKGEKGTCMSQPVTGEDAPTSCELRRSQMRTLLMVLCDGPGAGAAAVAG